ncbi:unnamed protein product [Heligmosomoides polygyrus]|uniref:Sulfotransfer_1 domain-containing protein n=1 Tax=Heligmosomoides polygyrus TaxID=6339 RepID=A0A3P7ZV08_HELPZ|nr:unnamed protein product [Heligmosomoides polygyrus]
MEVNETTNRADVERTTKIAVIRHPIDRFLSGFVNKCLRPSTTEEYDCYGCGQSLSCFVQHFRAQLWDVYRENDPNYNFFITNHLAPQTWYCNFKEHLRDYVFIKHSHGRYGLSKMATEMNKILTHAGSPSSLRSEITDAILVGRSHHSTFSSKHRRRAEHELYSNKTLLHIITELYYYDFLIFDFAWPTRVAQSEEVPALACPDTRFLDFPSRPTKPSVVDCPVSDLKDKLRYRLMDPYTTCSSYKKHGENARAACRLPRSFHSAPYWETLTCVDGQWQPNRGC